MYKATATVTLFFSTRVVCDQYLIGKNCISLQKYSIIIEEGEATKLIKGVVEVDGDRFCHFRRVSCDHMIILGHILIFLLSRCPFILYLKVKSAINKFVAQAQNKIDQIGSYSVTIFVFSNPLM